MFKRKLLAACLVLVSGCSAYQIPEREIARLESLVNKKEIKKINLHEFFQNKKHPKLKDYFFYVLYHLEQQTGDYLVEKEHLVGYFKNKDLNSSIPLDDLEKIVREGNHLKIYTGGFSETAPGTGGMISVSASEDLCFQTEKIPGRRDHLGLTLDLGTLHIVPNFPLNIFYDVRPQVKAIEVYDQGTNLIFYCQLEVKGQLKKSHLIYHSEDGTCRGPYGGWENCFLTVKKE